MAARKLQIFFVCRPFQNLFFLVGEKPVALLVDLVEDLVDALLCYVGDLFERLGAGNFVIELVLGERVFFFLLGLKRSLNQSKSWLIQILPSRPLRSW